VAFFSLDNVSGRLLITPGYDRGPETAIVEGPVVQVNGIGPGNRFPLTRSRYRMRGRGVALGLRFESNTDCGWRLGENTLMGLPDGRK
jgi:hypothetical protein